MVILYYIVYCIVLFIYCIVHCIVGNVADGGGCLNWTDFIRLKGILSDLEDSGYYISFSGQLVNGTKWDVRTSIFAAISVFTSVGKRIQWCCIRLLLFSYISFTLLSPTVSRTNDTFA